MVTSENQLNLENVIHEIFKAVDDKGAIFTLTFSEHVVTVQMFCHGISRDAIIERGDMQTTNEFVFEMIRAVRMLLYSIDRT